ncbi:MAG: 3,4-dihydroxyphenylacetate 2,3-dioxygenase, partial [uncultured Thermomicrobiales bacterium]
GGAARLRHPGRRRPAGGDRARPRPARHLQRALPLPARPGRQSHRTVRQRLSHGRSRLRADPLEHRRSEATDLLGARGAAELVRGSVTGRVDPRWPVLADGRAAVAGPAAVRDV